MTDDGNAHPEMQLNIMNTRAIAHIAQDKDRWQLAGDQLFIDMDISEHNMPPGTRLSLGTAIIEVTAIPHNGCKKFVARFGLDAMTWVNSEEGKKTAFARHQRQSRAGRYHQHRRHRQQGLSVHGQEQPTCLFDRHWFRAGTATKKEQ